MKWNLVELQEVALQSKGSIVSGPFGSNISSKFFVSDGIPVIRGNNLTKGDKKFIDEGFVFLTESKASEFSNCIAYEDDIIFTAAGSIGQVGIIPANSQYDKYIISNKQIRVRIDRERAIPMFVYYWLSSKNMVRYLESKNNGGAVPLLNLSIIRKVPVPLPSIQEQKSIIEFLHNYDELIQNNQRRIMLLEKSAQLLYREWFVYLRFPKHEHAKITNGIPDGWNKLQLGDLLTLQRGFDLPKNKREEGNVPIIASTSVNGFHSEAKVIGPGIVTGRSGSLGTVLYIHEDFWPLNTTLWVKEFKLVTPQYAYFLLSGLKLERYNGGAAVPTLNRNDVHRIKILCPPKELIEKFSYHVTPIFDQIKALENYNKKLKETRDILLPRLMKGEISV